VGPIVEYSSPHPVHSELHVFPPLPIFRFDVSRWIDSFEDSYFLFYVFVFPLLIPFFFCASLFLCFLVHFTAFRTGVPLFDRASPLPLGLFLPFGPLRLLPCLERFFTVFHLSLPFPNPIHVCWPVLPVFAATPSPLSTLN